MTVWLAAGSHSDACANGGRLVKMLAVDLMVMRLGMQRLARHLISMPPNSILQPRVFQAPNPVIRTRTNTVSSTQESRSKIHHESDNLMDGFPLSISQLHARYFVRSEMVRF